MITKLQSIDHKRLGTEEGTWGDTWISLGRGNRIDFMIESGWDTNGGIMWGELKEIGLRERMRGRNSQN